MAGFLGRNVSGFLSYGFRKNDCAHKWKFFAAPAISTTSKSVQRASKKDGTKKKRGRISESDVDPFSFDSNFDNHPEPLRNIQVIIS